MRKEIASLRKAGQAKQKEIDLLKEHIIQKDEQVATLERANADLSQ